MMASPSVSPTSIVESTSHILMRPGYFHNADINLFPVYDPLLVQNAFEHNLAMEYDFPQGGCQQRAHLTSMLLEKRFNIQHGKCWLFAPAALTKGDYRTLYVRDNNGLSYDNLICWNYHVAPVVRVQQGDTIVSVVFDASQKRDAPMLLDEWFESIGNSAIGQYSFLLPDKYFFNCFYENNLLTTIFDGTFYDYSDADRNDLTMEKGLAVNDMAMQMYRTYIKPLQNFPQPEDNHRLEDLKMIFGNSTVLDLLFNQGISGIATNTTHRYAITHYSDIMREAKDFFHERLVYWTGVVNQLL